MIDAGSTRASTTISCVWACRRTAATSLPAAAFNAALAALQHAFEVVHGHGNNYRPFDGDNGVPDTVEITLLNRALMPVGAAATTWTYPRPGLDFPNRPNAADYALRFD